MSLFVKQKQKNIFKYKGQYPDIHPTAFIHPTAVITGNVKIGENCHVGAYSVIEGLWGEAIIEKNCYISSHCSLHMSGGMLLHLKEGVYVLDHVGIRGSKIGSNTLIGMNVTIMDNVEVGNDCFLGAYAFLQPHTEIPDRKIAFGIPCKIVGDVTDEMVQRIANAGKPYRELPKELTQYFKEVNEA